MFLKAVFAKTMDLKLEVADISLYLVLEEINRTDAEMCHTSALLADEVAMIAF
jgi:hypothetical protein